MKKQEDSQKCKAIQNESEVKWCEKRKILWGVYASFVIHSPAPQHFIA